MLDNTHALLPVFYASRYPTDGELTSNQTCFMSAFSPTFRFECDRLRGCEYRPGEPEIPVSGGGGKQQASFVQESPSCL